MSAQLIMRDNLQYPVADCNSILLQNHGTIETMTGSLAERLTQAMKEAGITRSELSRRTKIGYSTIASIANGSQSTTTKIPTLAAVIGVHSLWLETGRGPKWLKSTSTDGEWADIPGMTLDAALGDGSIPPEYAEANKLKFRSESLRRKGLMHDGLAVIYGKGDSMSPTIKDGDALLIDTKDTTLRDEKLYVVSCDGDLMAKRVISLAGKWFLSSDNADDPKWRKPRAIDETRGFQVHGRVRWVARWED